MKSSNPMMLTLLLALAGATNLGHGADGATTPASAEEDILMPSNTLVVETDHGQGLGPNGEDLHYENSGVDPADDEGAALFLQALEEPTPLSEDTPIPEESENAASASSDEEGAEDTAVGYSN